MLTREQTDILCGLYCLNGHSYVFKNISGIPEISLETYNDWYNAYRNKDIKWANGRLELYNTAGPFINTPSKLPRVCHPFFKEEEIQIPKNIRIVNG